MLSSEDNSQLVWKDLSEGVSTTHFTSRFGPEQIYLKKIKAQEKSKNPITIFLFHDLTSYHGRFSNMIEWFKIQHPNISFVMMDFLGHGLSSGTRGHITNFSELVSNVAYIFESEKKQKKEKWIALGHGLGALAVLDLLNRFDESTKEKIDQLILSNFVLNFSSGLLSAQNRLLEKVLPLDIFMRNTRPLEIYLPKDILTYPKDQVMYLEDPLIVRKPTFQTFKCIAAKVKSVYQDAYFLDKPTLILQSESPYLLPRGMDSFSKGLKKGLLVEKKYSNLKHDLYNERENDIVFKDIAQWIQS